MNVYFFTGLQCELHHTPNPTNQKKKKKLKDLNLDQFQASNMAPQVFVLRS